MEGISEWFQKQSNWLRERKWIWLLLLGVWKLTEDRALSSANAWVDRRIQQNGDSMATLKEIIEVIPFITWAIIATILLGFIIIQIGPFLWVNTVSRVRSQFYRRKPQNDAGQILKGIFDHQVDFLDSMEQIGKLMKVHSSVLNRITKRFTKHTRKMANARGNPRRGQVITGQAAKDLDNQCVVLATTLPRLIEWGNIYSTCFQEIVSWTDSHDEDATQNIDDLMPSIREFSKGSIDAKESMEAYRISISALEGYSGELNQSCESLYTQIDGVIAFLDGLHQTTEQIIAARPIGTSAFNLQSIPDSQP